METLNTLLSENIGYLHAFRHAQPLIKPQPVQIPPTHIPMQPKSGREGLYILIGFISVVAIIVIIKKKQEKKQENQSNSIYHG